MIVKHKKGRERKEETKKPEKEEKGDIRKKEERREKEDNNHQYVQTLQVRKTRNPLMSIRNDRTVLRYQF